MSRQLTEAETQHLFKVCENNGVKQYDVQIELVDHLASLIEVYWKQKPEDPFKYAVYKAFQKFGSAGFKQVKEQKQKALAIKYRRILWHYLLDFYRWPKMLLTLMLSLLVYFLLNQFNALHWLFVAYTAIVCSGALIYEWRFKAKHKIETVHGKSFLLLHQIKHVQYMVLICCSFPSFANFIFIVLRSANIGLPTNAYLLLIFSFALVSLSIVLYAYFFYIPKKVKEHFMDQFAEFAV